MRIKSVVKDLLAERFDREYEKKLKEQRTDYDSWIRQRENGERESGNAQADAAAESPFVLILQERGELAEEAVQKIEHYLRLHPECDILYGDEDAVGPDGLRRNPWYRPCWSPDLYLDCYYPGSVAAVRKSAAAGYFHTAPGQDRILFREPAQIRREMDGILEKVGGFEKNCVCVQRLPEILFHVREESVWEEYLTASAGEELVGRMKALGDAREKLLSVIIPSKDNPEVLEKCLASLKKAAKGRAMEILVVDNGSSPMNREAVEKRMGGKGYLYQPMEFNFSAMCNLGAGHAQGELLLFLNDDVELCPDGGLDKMCAKAVLPYVGAVGMKLCYPDDLAIQHDGITSLPVGPVHKLQYFEDNKSYYFGRNRYDHNCLAVTGACLMVEKQKFWEAGGFDTRLRVAYNDVALGFRLREAGYQNVVLNHCRGLHYESLSRGSDETWEKQRRLEEERELLYSMYPAFRREDPFYPVQLNTEGLDSRIRPGYITSRNTVQPPDWKRVPKRLAGCRLDNCLMVRVETAGPDRIQGYSVVLGDDNACYERYLLLEPESGTGQRVCMKLEGQYRDDLEENLPDQKNAAMGGFRVSREGEKLEPGLYRIGVLAVRRTGGLKLLNWSARCLQSGRRDEWPAGKDCDKSVGDQL